MIYGKKVEVNDPSVPNSGIAMTQHFRCSLEPFV